MPAAVMYCLPGGSRGRGDAAYLLSTLYLAAGRRDEAYRWFDRAARCGYPEAIERLASEESTEAPSATTGNPVLQTAEILQKILPQQPAPRSPGDTQPLDVTQLLAEPYISIAVTG